MNKTEKLICLVLGLVLVFTIYRETQRNADAAKAAAAQAPAAQTSAPAVAPSAAAPAVQEAPAPAAPKSVEPDVPEKTVVLENDEVKLELSTWGAVVKKVMLKKYAKDCGPISEKNPPVVLDFSDSPLGAGETIEAFDVKEENVEGKHVVFANGAKTRNISLLDGYRISMEDRGISGSLSLGSMRMGDSKNDLLSVDSWAMDAGKGKQGVIHHCEGDSPLKNYLVGGLAGGCSGASGAANLSASATVQYPGVQKWVALKNRFFVTALANCSEPVAGFSATVKRDVRAANYRPESVTVWAKVADGGEKQQADGNKEDSRTTTFFVGPKKQSLLWDLGMKDVMEFGMWRWLCYPLVWVLNLFNGLIPNFGVAIILLTILVRLVFWPLTRKSTEGMKKMQEIQPKMKEIREKFKDNPQRMQMETFALYREAKVNPLSSCLPMLVQIPVFIALFNVLRSAVELRYAPFLWIADLSEPEGLFASWFPFGGLNILPVLMAVSTALQSWFTPSAGDPRQQRMMTVFMPVMMLFMFYSFPSALSLYWFLSNVFSIVQMWMIRRQTAAKKAGPFEPEVIDPPTTRQMRRHG